MKLYWKIEISTNREKIFYMGHFNIFSNHLYLPTWKVLPKDETNEDMPQYMCIYYSEYWMVNCGIHINVQPIFTFLPRWNLPSIESLKPSVENQITLDVWRSFADSWARLRCIQISCNSSFYGWIYLQTLWCIQHSQAFV